MGRTIDDLNGSRQERDKILSMLDGVIPESIMVHNRSERAIDLVVDRRYAEVIENREDFLDQYIAQNVDANKVKNTDKLKREFRSGFEGSRGKGKTLSRFSQNIGRLCVKFYTNKGDVVVDPFAGHNSRMELVFKAGRHYYGQDLCGEFMEDNMKIKDMLIEERKKKIFMSGETPNIVLMHADSRKLRFPDEIGDFTITSPPYWDLEYYGDEKEQLGNGSYMEFLKGLWEVAKENYRCLKKGAFCAWFINDFRKNGKFYNYHGDTIKILEKAGFVLHDIIIADLGPSLRSVFLQPAYKLKVLPKRHEYGVVVRKPL